eukprot:TRINITY_DN47377_c0_g1_i1.p1 TRINITY_DN47377_c0_g1~~TRINITY_DN47377_c0_g1_i1.p1  ORF type:complete len:664 (+),score=149.82 TRINITY_DN47377_c0_g1_i1:162-2153(+)
MEVELEALRREREEKMKVIAEKKKQVEELRRKRQERAAAQAKRAMGDRKASGDLGRTVDNLVLEILGGEGAGSAKAEDALKEVAAERGKEGAGRGSTSAPMLQMEIGVSACTVLPSEADVYDRTVQTDPIDISDGTGGNFSATYTLKGRENVLLKMADRARMRAVRPDASTQPGQRLAGQKRTVHAEAEVPGDVAKEAAAMMKDVKELTPEEKQTVMAKPDFQAFFERTSLLVERVLGQETWDNYVDLRCAGLGNEGPEEDLIQYIGDYSEEQWTVGRPVTDCRFSPKQHEMFLAAYGQKENPSLSDSDGCMLVWNLAMKHRPELVFTSQSAVLTAHFHTFNPALYFGGTYSGGVVMWDSRAKAGPVQRTPLSGKGHAHPIYGMQQVGTQNATNLVSVSNDGRLCVWSLAMLALPQETVDLKNETKNRRDLAVMSMCFPENETNTLYVGAEDGSVCQCHIHGSKVGVTEVYEGHEGPVTGLDMHPRAVAAQYGVEAAGDLAVSTSFDWSIKVWSVKQSQWPVLSLDNFEDYVYDARWHPTHPAVFASVDGEGHVDLWNLNRNLEAPVERCTHPSRRLAMNHCHWSADGKKLVAGDSEGMLSIFAVDRTVSHPRNEDYERFQDRVRGLTPIVPRVRQDTGFGGMGGHFHRSSALDAHASSGHRH